MRKRLLPLLGAALLLLSACSGGLGESAAPEGAYQVYYVVSDQERCAAAVDYEYYVPEGDIPLVAELMGQLLDGPETLGLESPFPEGVRLLNWSMWENQVRVNLSEQYGGLSGVGLTLADYCIALTLCQVEGVEQVYITVEGEEMAFRRVQQMSADDVLLSGAEEESVHVGVNLWFPRTQWFGLGVEHRQVTRNEEDTLRGVVLGAWLEGPEYASLTSYVPEGTRLLGAELEEGICYVDLSAEFLEGEPTDRQRATLLLYSMVNTLGSLDSVEGVQLLVEGQIVSDYGGINTARPLTPDFSLERN